MEKLNNVDDADTEELIPTQKDGPAEENNEEQVAQDVKNNVNGEGEQLDPQKIL